MIVAKFVAEELYTALSDYIRRGCVLLFRLFSGEEFADATLVTSVMRRNYGEARMLRLFADNLGYIAILIATPERCESRYEGIHYYAIAWNQGMGRCSHIPAARRAAAPDPGGAADGSCSKAIC